MSLKAAAFTTSAGGAPVRLEQRLSLGSGDVLGSHGEEVNEMGTRKAMVSIAAIIAAVTAVCILVILVTRITANYSRRAIRAQPPPLNTTPVWLRLAH
ncbi:hypothetical protein V5799_018704 [Amblyomma americanum]|uniref:Uncharacterized protein n=1 Tax=Amblyomma americanum TaxID=6943 RepID=A0AAQ4EBC1_AMBAM